MQYEDQDRRDDSKAVKALDGVAEVAWWYVMFDAIGNIIGAIAGALAAVLSSE